MAQDPLATLPPAEEEAEQLDIKPLSITALESIERAEIDVAIATAKRYPRDLASVIREMREMATKDPEIAASCGYALPRAGKEITGPSVRLAEIAANAFCNLHVVVRVVSMGDDVVTCQAVAHDLQKNVRVGLEVPRNVQIPKNPKNPEAALRDAKHNAALACNSIAYREAVFKVIPRSLVKKIYDECRQVAVGKGRSFDEARENCLGKFAELGVSRKKLYEYLEIGGIEALTTGHLQLLFGVLTAIQEGETSVEAEFGPKDKMPKDAVKAQVPEAPPAPKPAEPPISPPRPPRPPVPEDLLPDLPTTKAPPKPKPEAPKRAEAPQPAAPKLVELDPLYARVQKRMDDSKVSLKQVLRSLSNMGFAVRDVAQLTDLRVNVVRTADNDWQGILDDIAMESDPDEAA